MLAWRAADGSGTLVAPPSGNGPGDWQPTPPAFASYLLPQWGFVAPFAIPAGSLFVRPAPLFSTVRSGRRITMRSKKSARPPALRAPPNRPKSRCSGPTVPARKLRRVIGTASRTDVADAARNTLEENARMFALLNIALADAAICSWDAKYAYNFWRPVTAIRNGDTDRNDATAPDPAWISLIVTPPFPDYTSGHSTFSGAAATVLALFYGTNHVAFATGSDFLPGVFRSFQELLGSGARSGAQPPVRRYSLSVCQQRRSGFGSGRRVVDLHQSSAAEEQSFAQMIVPTLRRAIGPSQGEAS